ncbi:MAG TPA: hypothetical protein VFH58_03445 [Acidimicrobiales bacterium]|nr:hypothetical protein [Acidimicrobiales bacterium]
MSKAGEAARLSVSARAIRYLMRQGWRRGVVGGSPVWTAVCGLGLLGYLAGRAWHREPEVVFSEKLAPGEIIRITHEASPLP